MSEQYERLPYLSFSFLSLLSSWLLSRSVSLIGEPFFGLNLARVVSDMGEEAGDGTSITVMWSLESKFYIKIRDGEPM